MNHYLAQLFSLVLMVALASQPQIACANETTDQIQDAVNSYINEQLKNMADHQLFQNSRDIRVKIGRLDSRLRLTPCGPQDLHIEDHSGSILGGRYLLKTICSGENAWSLYVPVHISIIKPIVVATQSIPRGTTLVPEMLQMADWEIGNLKRGYLDNLDLAIGRELRRPLNAGRPISPDQLGISHAVIKGDEVLIEASTGLLSVKSMGIALSNGSVGEQINVRNSRSEKIIRARVVEAGNVRVAM